MRNQIPRRPILVPLLDNRRRGAAPAPAHRVPVLVDHGRTGGDESTDARLVVALQSVHDREERGQVRE